MAEAGKLPHALLFAGPEKIGKKTLAIETAKFIFCQEGEPGDRPCQKCRACSDVASRSHPDLSLVLAQEGAIKIAQIRDFGWRLSLKPYSAKIKVGIIDDIHLAESDAQNSLLKTLEEPKGDTLLILVTHSPQMLLKTVFSRVQVLKFPLVSQKEIEDHLISLGADRLKAGEIADLSLGRPGQAIDFLNDPEKVKIQEQEIKDIGLMLKSGIPERFGYVKKITDSPETVIGILDLWERELRRLLLQHPEGRPGLVRGIKALEDTVCLIKTTNANQRLALENLMLNLNI